MLDQITSENRVALLMIGRPYHNDPGLNHAVLEEFQALGYPILSMRSIPKNRAYLDPIFAQDLKLGHIEDPRDVSDVWPENYSVNSVQKVWAAKFAARHPNVAVMDLSSFKCGHDAPTYGLIDSIIASAGKAYSALHDIDANKPSGSIKIRVKTYAHTLMLLRERLEDQSEKQKELELGVAKKRVELLEKLQQQLAGIGKADANVDTQLAMLRDLLAASAKGGKRAPQLAVLR
jgi:predicted nucleotide-binding protein (sugar kinase/HSP70/actin superfamily)